MPTSAMQVLKLLDAADVDVKELERLIATDQALTANLLHLANSAYFASTQPCTTDSRIVVVEMAGQTVGMVVDGVSEVLRVGAEAIEPPSPIVTTVDSAFIRGIAKLGERLVILLDLAAFVFYSPFTFLLSPFYRQIKPNSLQSRC